MRWQIWVDIPTIAGVVRHTSGTVVSIALFSIVGWLIKFCPLGDITRARIESCDHLVIVTLFWLLGAHLILGVVREFWNTFRSGWNGTQVFAI
jgi:hypothetical protein